VRIRRADLRRLPTIMVPYDHSKTRDSNILSSETVPQAHSDLDDTFLALISREDPIPLNTRDLEK
jgi:hypothetical protein